MDETAATPEGDEQQPVLTVTEPARQKVLSIRDGEPDGDRLALWVEVSGATGGEYTYDMYFEVRSAAAAEDVVQEHDDLTLVVPHDSVDRLRGATLGMSRDLLNPGMAITNPNRPAPPPSPSPAVGMSIGSKPADLSGPVAQRVAQVLEQQINPSIASHGGEAQLVAVEDGTAYLRLGGGCVGCGMASVTLSQGIEVAIKDSVPEITEVVDVTDHASGTNPYYESAKK
ncbi:MAG TPA: NifU family protein [Acidimicrobiales bacterium]|nr:NifU family protein [Acidimicrobiales bacterium]